MQRIVEKYFCRDRRESKAPNPPNINLNKSSLVTPGHPFVKIPVVFYNFCINVRAKKFIEV